MSCAFYVYVLSPHSVLQSICLFRRSSNISRKVSGPVVGSAGSPQTLILLYFSLHFLQESNCPSSPQSQDLTCCTWVFRNSFPSSSFVTHPLMFCFGSGPASTCMPTSNVCSQPRQEGVKARLVRLSQAGERQGYGHYILDVGVSMVVETCWILLQSEELAPSCLFLGKAKLIRLPARWPAGYGQ